MKMETLCPEWSEPESQAIRAQLARILASEVLSQSPRRRRFLEYVVNATLTGAHDRLKGYTIGVEVFGKPASFDPALDTSVRVEAGRLRDKLREYYLNGGQSDPVYIDLPKGRYVPQIVFREQRPTHDAVEEQNPPAELGPAQREIRRREDAKPTLAVLPFTNLSGDISQDYLADGLTDVLITDLSRVSGLVIVSRHSSFAYRHTQKPLSEVAASFAVRYLVEGSVHRLGDRLRIAARLIDTRADLNVLWAERYERELTDIFALEDEVSRRIVEALKVRLTPVEAHRLGQGGTASIEAHDALLRGLEQYWKYTRESVAAALRHFQDALACDPGYAAAHAWLARAYVFQGGVKWVPDVAATLKLALEHGRRAVQLDDLFAYGHAVLGWALLFAKHGAEAVTECRRACAMDPNSADAHLFLAFALATTAQGAEGLRCIETGMRLNPHPSAFYLNTLGNCYFSIGAYEEAIDAMRRGIAVTPAFMPNHYELAIVLALCGKLDEAHAEAEIVRQSCPEFSKQFYLDPSLAATYERGKRLAGLQ
jgi:TolB-like protein/Tfp pilus assembly protein PilF